MKPLRTLTPVALLTASLLLSHGCSELRTPMPRSDSHLQQPEAPNAADEIPAPVRAAPPVSAPQPQPREPRHTVVVHQVPASELLFALARDLDLDVDIAQDITATVTLNALDQPLRAILDRIAEQADLRIELHNDVLRIRPDTPFLRNYRIDYLNMSRNSQGGVAVSSQISSTGRGAAGDTGGGGDNNSSTSVSMLSEHNFWVSLRQNILSIISNENTDPATFAAETPSPNLLLNPESGVIAVRATQKQHAEVQAFLDEVLLSSQRQVLIEATIAEVKLSDGYQAGIDWSLLSQRGDRSWRIDQAVTDTALLTPPTTALTLTDLSIAGNALQSTLRALETFGDVSIMSSPKVMALNNQTAMLKVVDNVVYFTLEIDTQINEGVSISTFETEVNTVPVGFVMSVTPFINDRGSVTLNVRPTVSRVVGQVRDPNPELAAVDVISEIPIIQVREVESVLKVDSGDIAVIGGLMQDDVSQTQQGIPILSRLPVVGSLFRYEEDRHDKTELVIFIKPIVVNHASVQGDLRDYRSHLAPASEGNRAP